MSTNAKIDHKSRRYRAYHEAGHCMTAYAVGARIDFMEVFSEAGGVCRVVRQADPNIGMLIATGGFAIEYLLWSASRTVGPDGVALTEKQFIDVTMNNASDDKQNYFSGNHADADGVWPKEMDEEFIRRGKNVVANQLRQYMDVIETLALRLDQANKLSGTEVEQILADHGITLNAQ
ncbi:hypothetical protein ACG04R_16410 [Roseateles sp. BYS78W]|uniref:Peptidase M41 domain-containing protein n=1 Tax=Pelomonas candidula TaxID=3299025 RepID=A0ABW7HEC1_9BURK